MFSISCNAAIPTHTHAQGTWEAEEGRKHKEQSEAECIPSVSLSGSAEGAVFISTQISPTTSVKELSKAFMKVTDL